MHGRGRSRPALTMRVEAVPPEQVRAAFGRMLAERPSDTIAGRVGKGAGNRFVDLSGGSPSVTISCSKWQIA